MRVQNQFIFHFIGVFSTVSLFLAGVNFLPGILQGDFETLKNFFENYRGIEPFVIFIFPVILIVGCSWIWHVFKSWKRPPSEG